MNKITYFFLLLIALVFAVPAGATDVKNTPVWMANQPVNDYNIVVSAYKTVRDLGPLNIKVPTVVEMPIHLNLNQRREVVVYDVTDKKFIASYLKASQIDNSIKYTVSAKGGIQSVFNDHEYGSCLDFDLPVNASINNTSLTFNYDKEITSDSLYLSLDNYVTLPVSLGIKAVVGGTEKVVLAPARISGSSISFPKVTSKKWTVDLSYIQPLRICEASFSQNLLTSGSVYSVRFLAEKDHGYQVYSDSDRSVNVSYPEAPKLTNDFGVLQLVDVADADKINVLYKISDFDNDGVPDIKDNCVSISNTDQADIDQNGRGDACDDYDQDGVINFKDNCSNVPNYNQADTDADGVGDKCDTDEGRITERYTWLPWVGMIFAGLVVIGLFVFTALSMRKKTDLPPLN
jgi:hypothetical protein